MTKKDYIIIAKVFKKTFDSSSLNYDNCLKNNELHFFTLHKIINDFCVIAKEDNKRFDKTRFKEYIGYESLKNI